MPAHGNTPDEILDLFTKAGGSWWLALSTNRPAAGVDTFELAAIPALEVARADTFWADAADGAVIPLATTTLPAATADTTVAAWCLFNDSGCTDLALSRWFVEDETVAAGTVLPLAPEALTIEFTPQA